MKKHQKECSANWFSKACTECADIFRMLETLKSHKKVRVLAKEKSPHSNQPQHIEGQLDISSDRLPEEINLIYDQPSKDLPNQPIEDDRPVEVVDREQIEGREPRHSQQEANRSPQAPRHSQQMPGHSQETTRRLEMKLFWNRFWSGALHRKSTTRSNRTPTNRSRESL